MNIALLSAGPSLSRYWHEGLAISHDCVIAVNTAAWEYRCDWLVYADAHVWRGCVARSMLPKIGIVTHPVILGTVQLIQGMPLPLRNTLCYYAHDLPQGRDYENCPWTFPNALAFAHSLQPDRIDVYGFDAAVDAPCIGNLAHPGSHDAERWQAELPWVKHCWSDKVTLYSDLAPAAADYLGMGVKA